MRKIWRATFCVFSGMAFIVAIATVLQARVQPTNGFDFFSPQEEIQAGQQSAAEMERQLPLLPESDPITKYVQKLGHELAAHAPGEKWPYSFHVVNQKEINAFALPGGPVFINLGTIQAADNEAELAGVLAHEIAHIVQRHGTRAASKQMAAELPLAILGGVMGRGTRAQMAQLGISFGVGSYFLKNSRQSESEADLLGTDIMYDTGFDPHAMAVFFSKLEEQSGKQGTVAQFLSDHPNPGNRANAVSQEVSTLPFKQYRSDSAEFLKIKQRIAKMQPMTAAQIAEWQKLHPASSATPSTESNGINPNIPLKQLHEDGYEISYPENWQVSSPPANAGQDSRVVIAPPAGISPNYIADGIVIDTYRPSSPNVNREDASHAVIDLLRQANPKLRPAGNVTDIRVNGLAGKSIDLIENPPLQALHGSATPAREWLVCIRRSDGSVLYLVSIAPENSFDAMRPTFEQVLRSVKLY